MTVFGTRDVFALEFDCVKGTDDVSIPGHMQFWIGGQPVGEYEVDCLLGVAAAAVDSIVRSQDRRHDTTLASLVAKDVYEKIDRAVFDDDGRTDAEVEADSRFYRRFVVQPAFESFDGWRILAIDTNGFTRLIWCNHVSSPNQVNDFSVDTDYLNLVLREFIEYVAQVQAARGARR